MMLAIMISVLSGVVYLIVGAYVLCFIASEVHQKGNAQAVVLILIWPLIVVVVIGTIFIEYLAGE